MKNNSIMKVTSSKFKAKFLGLKDIVIIMFVIVLNIPLIRHGIIGFIVSIFLFALCFHLLDLAIEKEVNDWIEKDCKINIYWSKK